MVRLKHEVLGVVIDVPKEMNGELHGYKPVADVEKAEAADEKKAAPVKKAAAKPEDK